MSRVRRRFRHISLVGVEAFPPQADDPLARALPLAKVPRGVSGKNRSTEQLTPTPNFMHYHIQIEKSLKHCNPGDSSRDLFIPNRWRSPTTFDFGSLSHPKRSHRIAKLRNPRVICCITPLKTKVLNPEMQVWKFGRCFSFSEG